MINIDFENIDIYNIGAWPKVIKVLAFIIALCFVWLFSNWIFVSSKVEKLASLKAEEAKLRQFYVSKQKLLINIEEYKKQMNIIKGRLSRLVTQLPSANEVPNLIDQFSQAGLSSGLSFKEIEIMPENKFKYYVELPIKVKTIGNYHELGDFISKVSELSRVITFHDFKLKKLKNENDTTKLELQIMAKTYRYLSDSYEKRNDLDNDKNKG